MSCNLCEKKDMCKYKNDRYCRNCSKKLREVSDVIIGKQFPWLAQMHYDDFYSIADEVLWNCLQRYDGTKKAQFETYLIGCLTRKFKTRVTYMNRKRRSCGSSDLSLDALIDDGDTTLMNLVAVNNKEGHFYSDKMKVYLGKLSKKQRQVLFAIAEGYSPEEIKTHLNLSPKEYLDICSSVKSYRNVSILY